MPFPLFPEQASTVAGRIDALYAVLIGLALFFSLLVICFVVYFVLKYRRGVDSDRSNPINSSLRLETFWSVIPLLLALGVFAWSANLYFDLYEEPDEALEIYVVGKQWMWKFQHPGGQREIEELHVPVGRTVKLIMTSQDVIHSFFVPAFRIKRDVLPGRFTTVWFEATETGEYYLFCSEYCGTSHSEMGNRIVVMEQQVYEQWLAGTLVETDVSAAPGDVGSPQSLAAEGEILFRSLGCSGCHAPEGGSVGPSLVGLYGQPVPLEDESFVVADDQYIHDSILLPQQQIVAGYPAIMPSYQGQIEEDEVIMLIAYIRSLGDADAGVDEEGTEGIEESPASPLPSTLPITGTSPMTGAASITETSTTTGAEQP